MRTTRTAWHIFTPLGLNSWTERSFLWCPPLHLSDRKFLAESYWQPSQPEGVNVSFSPSDMIEWCGQTAKLVDGEYHWIVPESRKSCETTFDEVIGGVRRTHRLFNPLAIRVEPQGGRVTYTVNSYRFPVFQPATSALRIEGPFDGDFHTSEASIGGKRATVLAESIREVLIEIPRETVGVQRVSVSDGIKRVEGLLEFYRNRFSLQSDDRHPKSRTLVVEAEGLESQHRPVDITLASFWIENHLMFPNPKKQRIRTADFLNIDSQSFSIADPTASDIVTCRIPVRLHLKIRPEGDDYKNPSASMIEHHLRGIYYLEVPTSSAQGDMSRRKLKEFVPYGGPMLSINVQPAFDPTIAPNAVPNSIRSWEKDTGIAIESGTVTTIISEFSARATQVAEYARGYQATIYSATDFVRSIIRLYLFQALDRKQARVASSIKPQLAFAAFGSASTSVRNLDRRDFFQTVAEFFESLRNAYGTQNGWMEFTSTPGKMEILDHGALVGSTIDSIGFSVGHHEVTLFNSGKLACSFDLVVLPGPNPTQSCGIDSKKSSAVRRREPQRAEWVLNRNHDGRFLSERDRLP